MTLPFSFNAVAEHVLESSAFAVIVWCLASLVFRRSRASVRHSLWFAASLKFLVPFGILVAAGHRLTWLWLVPPRVPQTLDLAFDQFVSRLPMPVILVATTRILPDAPSSPLPWLLLWACGVSAIVAQWSVQWLRAHRIAGLGRTIAVVGGVPVLSLAPAPTAWAPGVFGVIRPKILVPAELCERLTRVEFDAILTHEWCHIERRDNLIAMIHSVVEALFWFHPLVWWLGGRLHEERERACDETLIGRGVDETVYAEGLLAVCRFCVESPLLSVSGVTGGNLTNRLENIMSRRTGRALNGAQHALLLSLAAFALVGPLVLGMTNAVARAQIAAAFSGLQTTASMHFDVASIKQNTSGNDGWRLGPPQRGAESIDNLELRKIIASSFRIQDKMVVGGPGWLDSARFDIRAKGAPDTTDVMVWEMMRSLLADRFHLEYHIEEREMPAYVLSIAKGGHKLKDPMSGLCGTELKAGRPCGAIRFPPFGVAIDNMPVGALTAVLARRLQDRPVVDDTGLTALYDATVRWMPDEMTFEEWSALPADVRPPDVHLFDAFEQQAGLKLSAKSRPVRVVVVDSIQKPDPD